jgi:pimeloyl-ACP methyl ester carboxylesterase
VRRKKTVKRVLLSLLIFVISFSLISMLVSAMFYGVFFPRRDTAEDYTLRYSGIDSSSYPRERVRFLSGGRTLTGYCYPCDDPAGLIVISGGFGEVCDTHLGETMAFVDNGFSVFCFDCTGVGESEGNGTVGLAQPSLDLRAALMYIADDPALNRLPVFLYGHSAGGYAAATCADQPCVKAAVVLSGFESPTLLMRESARNYVGVFADIEYPFLSLQTDIVFGGQGSKSASDCLKKAGIPALIYEGSDDRTIPPCARLSRYLSDSSDITVTICDKPPKNGHSGIWLTEDALACRTNDSGNPDPVAANEVDREFLRVIMDFYRKSLEENH